MVIEIKQIINNINKSDTCKIQLTIANNYVSSIDNNEEHVIHSKSHNIEIMINDDADEVMKELSGSLKSRYQNNLESMQGSEFVFDYVNLLYYKCHKINPNCGRSYIESPDWIKSRKAIINPNNKKTQMFSIHFNSPAKSSRNKRRPPKNSKN